MNKGSSMPDCQHCKHAEWDYDDFYFGGPVRHWFLTGCKKEVEDIGGCKEWEEGVDFDVQNGRHSGKAW